MSKYLIDDQPLIVLPKLAEKLGLNESLFLQQVHYWLLQKRHIKDGYYWTYNSYPEWLKQFPFWSESTLKRTVSNLENKGLIITGNYNSLKIDKTKWYRIDYEILKELTKDIEEFNGKADNFESVQNDTTKSSKRTDESVNMNRPLPEITTKNTTNNKTFLSEDKSSDVAAVMKFYKTLEKVPRVVSFSDKRKKHINARLREYGLEVVKQTLIKATESNFLVSNIGKQNFYDLDWIFNQNNFVKILEGKYDNKKTNNINNKEIEINFEEVF